jgi:PKD repeat protein
MQDYLGVGNAVSDLGHTVVIGSGTVYGGLGPYTLDYPYWNWSDLVEPDITAEVAFNGDLGNAGVSKSTLTYLTTYLGFGFEAISDVLDRRDVLNAFFESCPDDPSPIVTIIDPLDNQSVSGTYRVLVEAYDDGTITLVDLTIDGGSSIDITTSFDGTHYYYDWDTSVDGDGVHTLQARAIDNASNSQDSALINVTVANNQPPVASFTYDCAGLNCSFDATDSSDPEGDSLTYDWVFGDGQSGNGVTASHSYAFAGVYTVQLTVADSAGLTDTDSQQVIASEQKIHVADLDGFKSNSSRGRWSANVVITVFDEEGNLENGVIVDGDWSNGAGGSTLCTTGIGGAGQCQVTKSNLKGNVASVDFTIVSLTKGGYVYDPGSNGDPDGDSNGTVITVYKDTQEPPPPPPGDTPMHLAGLTGFASLAPKGGKWNANVTVIVHSGDPDSHVAIPNILVSGSWSGGITGGGSCTTNSSGTCTITKANIKSNVSSVSFTIDGLSDGGGTYFYNPPENHDENGDPFPTLTVDILKP